ncbi:MAG: DUF4393 domain-containing protein [Defluviitaleaceae bacterium]|nr:DUF4393 domain-containing protein [Defluviitaleaceae bacterium]
MEKLENKIIEKVIDKVGDDLYKDAVQPVARPTVNLLGLIPRAIKAALLPVEKWIIDKEYNLAVIEAMLAEELEKVNPKKISPPETYVAAPTLLAASYCMDSDELRSMFAKLLAKSMYKDTRNDVHPSYVEIIKQLCPDEAKILKVMDSIFPIIEIYRVNKNINSKVFDSNFSDIGEIAKCEYPYHAINNYIENIKRLGIITKSVATVHKSVYEPLKQHPYIKDLIKTFNARGRQMEIVEGLYQTTMFGHLFINVCVNPIKLE